MKGMCKRKILGVVGAVLMMIFGAAVMNVVQAEPTYAGSCTDTFLGMRPWYYDLCQGTDIKTPTQDELPGFVWRIVLNIIFDVSLAIGYIATGMVVYGGYMYMMSQGDPGKAAKGKKTLTAAVIGVVIAMGATVIVNTIAQVLTGTQTISGVPQGFDKTRMANVLNWLYAMSGVVAVVFIIKSGFEYMVSQGDPGKAAKATKGIIFSLVGLVIVILAAAITNFLLSSVGGAM